MLRYERVRRVHGFSDDQINQFVADLVQIAVMVLPDEPPPILGLTDADDALVIQAAIEGQADVLCTLDRHLLQRDVRDHCRSLGVEVLTDIELIARLRSTA